MAIIGNGVLNIKCDELSALANLLIKQEKKNKKLTHHHPDKQNQVSSSSIAMMGQKLLPKDCLTSRLRHLP